MPLYRHTEASGGPDDILVIEDWGMLGQDQPGFEFIDSRTIKGPSPHHRSPNR